MTDAERVKGVYAKMGSIKKTAKEVGLSRDLVTKIVKGGKTILLATTTANRGKSLAQFKQVYDVKLRIRQGISKHLRGVYMTDQEFRDACGVGTNEWRRYADEMEFDQFRAKIRGQVLWASAKMLAEMKQIAGVIQ